MIFKMTTKALLFIALALCTSIYTVVEAAPLAHNIQKRTTRADVLGDLTAGASGILNIDDSPQPNCKEIYDSGHDTTSGLYKVDPGDDKGEFTVFCDMNLQGGGWTVISRHVDDNISFDRKWKAYRNGFGNYADENFWLGLEKIKRITDYSGQTFELYIGLESFSGATTLKWAKYGSFSLDTELNDYKLTVSNYDTNSDAGDSLTSHSGEKFSTPDEDNDSHTTAHCASDLKSGWWYEDCHDSHLTGKWYANGILANINVADGIHWDAWLGSTTSLKTAVMAVRPA